MNDREYKLFLKSLDQWDRVSDEREELLFKDIRNIITEEEKIKLKDLNSQCAYIGNKVLELSKKYEI